MEDLYNQTDKQEYLPIHLKYLFQDVTKVNCFLTLPSLKITKFKHNPYKKS